jgi:hypothetical protein
MKVLLLTQEACNVDHPDEDKGACPGFSPETRLQVAEADSVYDAVRSVVGRGTRVITAFPAKTAMEVLGNALASEWSSVQLRSDFFGGRYTPEMAIPAGFYAPTHPRNHAPTFYLDPRADSQPVENPHFHRGEETKMPPLLKKGDMVFFEIPEEADDFYWRDACGAKDDADIEEVKAHVRKKFGVEFFVVSASPGQKLGLADGMGVVGMGAPTIRFSCYPCFVTRVSDG